MKKKDKEIKELRERLNHQAARSLMTVSLHWVGFIWGDTTFIALLSANTHTHTHTHVQYDDSSFSSHMDTMSPQRYSGPHNKSGEHYIPPCVAVFGGGGGGGAGDGGWNTPTSPPNQHHPNAQRLPHPPGPSPSHLHQHQPQQEQQRRSGEQIYNTGGLPASSALPGPLGGTDRPFRAGAWTTQVPAQPQTTYSQ